MYEEQNAQTDTTQTYTVPAAQTQSGQAIQPEQNFAAAANTGYDRPAQNPQYSQYNSFSQQCAPGTPAPQGTQATQAQTIDGRAFKLAQAIRDNKHLREEFLKIINRPAAENSAQAVTQQALSSPAQAQQTYNQSLETPKSGADFFTEFESYRPDFFKSAPARVQLKDYLMRNCAGMPRDEMYKVSNLAVHLENQAVQAFKSRLSHQNSLINGNEAAKEHLATSSAYPKNQDFSHAKIFSRKEISKMSAKEFRQNEREIFAQYRDGLIL